MFYFSIRYSFLLEAENNPGVSSAEKRLRHRKNLNGLIASRANDPWLVAWSLNQFAHSVLAVMKA
jgi:hypothetical protein